MPSDMEGKVVTDLFAEAPLVEYEQVGVAPAATPAATGAANRASSEDAYSDAELEAVKARLSDLGYLE